MTIFDREGHYVFIFPAYCGTECPEGFKIKGTRMPETDYATALPALFCAVSQGYRSLDRDCGTRTCEEKGHMTCAISSKDVLIRFKGSEEVVPHDGSIFEIERAIAEGLRKHQPQTHELQVVGL